MLYSTLSCPISLILLLLLSTLASTSPLKIDHETRSSLIKREVFYVCWQDYYSGSADEALKTAECPGGLPQDVSDYPAGIGMKPTHILKSGEIIGIEFIDAGFPVELWDAEGLCDAAGCYCNGPLVNCYNRFGMFYNRVIAAKYAEMCFHTCSCVPLPEVPLGEENANQIDLGEGVIVNLPDNLHNVANRNNPDGAILGHGACLAGEETGWTFKEAAGENCCKGYSFNAMSAQEAYMIYGLPYVSDIISGIVTIGVCLKSISP